jgi:DtxR family transcriptional regulator, Mn-dependent transcriptional regulator
MHTQAIEDYLKAIYELQETKASVSTSALAAKLEVTPASVTGMLKKLSSLNLVVYQPYRGVNLTEVGEKAAVEIVRHHRLIELFLAEALGVPWDMVHEEAHKIEHVLSEYLEEQMDAALGYPTVDPHGAPIPNRDGMIKPRDSMPLGELKPGETALVVEVNDHSPAFLRQVAEIGIFPQEPITVLDRDPMSGTMIIRVENTEQVIGCEVYNNVFVTDVTILD